MRGFLFAVAVSCMVASSVAGEPSISGPDTVDAGKPAFFVVEMGENAVGAFFPNEVLTVGPPHLAKNHGMFWMKTPGKYTISAMVVVLDSERRVQGLVPLSKVVEVKGNSPDPPLPPDPPSPGKKQVVIVFKGVDRDNYTRGQQVLLASLTFRSRLKAEGHTLLTGGIINNDVKDSKGNVPKSLAPFLSQCKGKSLPQLCWASVSGGKITTVPLPETEDEVLVLLGPESATWQRTMEKCTDCIFRIGR